MSAATARFEHLLAPGSIGRLSLRNRIILCPLGDSLAEPDGSVSERQRAFYGARARGGVGLILVGSVAIAYPDGSFGWRQTAASEDRFLPGLQSLADEVHHHGALIGAQLVHDGANSRLDIERGVPLLVPSNVRPRSPDRLTTMVTAEEASALMRPFTQPTSKLEVREATDADLAAVIDSFASAAARVVAAGFDAIEVHAGHGYLLDAFLSPASNRRVDTWGGDVAGRSRLLVEVISAVRAAVGPGVGVWMRINAEERYTEGGETLDDMIAVLALAEAAGIDAVHVSAYSNPMVGVGITDAHTPHEPGLLVPLVRAVAAVATVPVIGFGRLEPDAANELIASGGVAFVAMGRKLLADADLPRKLAEGRIDDVRPCIYHYRCIGNIFLSEPLACVASSATGHGDESRPPLAVSPRSIVVVGGGPAGLEAARLLAASGHRVALCEAADELGGRLRLAAVCDPTMKQLLAWLIRQVAQAGVDVQLGVRFAAGLLNRTDGESTVDLVVDATGTAWPGIDPLGPWLTGEVAASVPGFDIAIFGGDRPGLTLARAMLGHGRRVTVVETSGVFGQMLGLPGRFREVHDLEQLGARLVTDLPPERFDAVIDTAPSVSRPLHGLGVPVVRIGDVTGSVGIEAAFSSGRKLATDLAHTRSG